jgi:hypothetical protein
LPNPPGSELGAVACAAVQMCIAAGTSRTGGVAVDVERNGRWSVQTAPTPSHATAVTVAGISCATAGACLLVGSYANAGRQTTPLVERYS